MRRFFLVKTWIQAYLYLYLYIHIYIYIYIYIYINRYEKKTQYHFIPICGLDLLKHRSSCQF